MSDSNKEYYPEKITSNPLPAVQDQAGSVSSSGAGGEYGAMSFPPAQFPRVPVSRETIGQNLDTKSRKILGQFQFGSLGAIQVGTYEFGVSGEVKISPDGFVAKNVNGETTVAIDGTTGDATFRGTLQAGSIVSGNVTVSGLGAFIVNDGTYNVIIMGYLENGF